MIGMEDKFEANPDETADRTPAACPFCGHDGSFDSHGEWPDTFEIVQAGRVYTYDVTWDAMRCPNCNGYFRMLTTAEYEGAEEYTRGESK